MLNNISLSRFSLFLILSSFLTITTLFAQGQHPIIQRIITKDPDIIIFKQKVTSPDKFTVVAAVDKQLHRAYFVSRYGTIVDSIPIAEGDYKLIETGQVTAFDQFNALNKKLSELMTIAREQIQRTGDLDPNWEYLSWGKLLLRGSGKDPEAKIAMINDQRDFSALKRWMVNNPNPNNPRNDYTEQPEFADTYTLFKNNGSDPLDSNTIAKVVFMENRNRPVNTELILSLGLGYNYSQMVGDKVYELTDHRGNVMAEISDKRIQHSTDGRNVDHYESEIVGSRDYYAFGMTQPGRAWNLGDGYRYGYNGKENDVESGWQDYGMRTYNTQLGRFLSIDPITKQYPELTPYQFASNTPVQAIDLDGAEALIIHGTWSDKSTWGKEFAGNMLKATGWDKVQKQIYYGNWSGANTLKARQKAADSFYDWLISDKNPHRDLKHVTLIGHSHGGNINKSLKNKLEDNGWEVDMINIETPQRKDFQSRESGSGIYLNFYNKNDIIQKFGAINFEGPLGSRLDPVANKNIELSGSIPFLLPGPLVPINTILQWLKDSGGHGLHNNNMSQSLIESKTKQEFENRRQSQKNEKIK